MSDTPRDPSQVIAIVGMAGRFPGAGSVEEYWSNLCRGVESVSFFSDRELAEAGVPAELRESPRYVPARSILDGIEGFDAELFGFSPREAEVMDPQLRIFLECAWETLERAGCDPQRYGRPIGIYAGVSMNTYLLQCLLKSPAVLQSTSALQLRILNDKDFLTTWVSYRLGLRGPSMAVQTACSTSLVAVHVACQSLLSFECDAALAGGVAVSVPQRHGYLYEEGGIFSPDGHCRPFDAAARGTVSGNGAGLVLLKRLEDALADGDPIHALIRGTAVNNDGSLKMGYLAPSADSQAEAIVAAQSLADVSPETLGYVETHGTGTPLGDPIEISALTRVFREATDRQAFCALGSVKSNIGHLDQAAGVAGLIKAALAVEHGLIPPSLHFETPNPEIGFAGGPFYVNTRLAQWRANGHPRRAGVSSFGVGGTNAHVVIEQPPPCSPSGPSRARQLLLLSARTPAALDALTRNLGRWLGEAAAQEPPSRPALADVAWTLQVGRRELEHRRALVCESLEDAAAALCGPSSGRLLTGRVEKERRGVAFLFPGQGSQYPDMGLELYRSEPVFRNEVDRCCELLAPRLGFDLRRVLYPGLTGSAPDLDRLAQTSIAQPALFVVEHALAKLWMEWGVEPKAMIGHSLGEYVAACLAGVLTLEDALAVVAARGRLMQGLRRGAMLSVGMTEEELVPLLGERLSLAAVNGPRFCVVSGPEDEVEGLRRSLEERGIEGRRLHTSHAFHSSLMDPAHAAFKGELERIELRPPEIPFLSNVTGTWITDGEATDPAYWARQMRQTVRFADGAATLLREVDAALLEVGPGRALSTFVRAQAEAVAPSRVVATSLRHARDETPDLEHLLGALGRLWLAGVSVDWQGFHAGEERRREVLPTYPFDRKRYWVEPAEAAAPVQTGEPAAPAVAAAPEAAPVRYDRPAVATPYEPPRDEAERTVTEIWTELLGIRDIGIHDDFFELGGHSLLASQVVSRVRNRLGVALELSSLFATPTVAGLRARIEELRGELALQEATFPPPLTRVERTGLLPLSFAQERLWFLDSLEGGSAAYNMPTAVEIRGELRPEALAAALTGVVHRHEVLRTRFEAVDGVPGQVVSPPVAVPLPVVDLGALPEEERGREAARLAEERARHRFDLAQGPLLEAFLLRLTSGHHRFLVTMHHIVSDGWSIGVFVRELAALYDAALRGVPSPLPGLPLQYADFAAWQRRWLEGEGLAVRLAAWRERLSGAPAGLELPTDRPHPPVQTFRGRTLPWRLDEGTATALRALCRTEGVTLFTALLAVYFVLLHRYSGQDDLVVGTPVAGRDRQEIEGLIGLFINTLALRGDLSGGPAVGELLGRVRKVVLEAQSLADVPFEKLVEELRPVRDLARPPLFQTLLALQNLPWSRIELPGVVLSPLAVESGTAKYELIFWISETGEGLSGLLEHNSDLFDRSTVQRMGRHFAALLAGAAAGRGARLSDLPLLEEAEQAQILREWNDTGAVVPEEPVPVLFGAQAARSPEAPAVVFAGRCLTYRELDLRANRLARVLRSLGIGPEALVGVALERSIDLVVAVLAILKSGGAYLPLDPAYPPDRLAFMMSDSGVRVLLSEPGVAERLPAHSATVLHLEESAVPGEGEDERAPGVRPELDSLAYVLYTSGSTGRPKGVQVSHGALTNFLASMRREPGLGAGDRLLAVTSLSFDIAALELLLPLLAGGCVELAGRDEVADGVRLAARLADPAITAMQATPSTWRMLLDAGWAGRRGLKALCGGEALPPALAVAVEERTGELWNLYGPTETTVWSAVSRVHAGAVSLGRPIANTSIHLLDRDLRPVPAGAAGEIYIGGAGLARGYLGRPDLTVERFVPDAWGGGPGSRLYRTGDLARRRADGTLEFLGRLDHQVKVRGFRIELGEIEATLSADPGVRAAVVVARDGGQPGETRLVAYVVPAQEPAPSPAELRRALRGRLPDYMVPADYLFLESLPLTPNGKVDRKALPVPAAGPAASASAFATPRTAVEEVLAGIWADVLHVDRVGIDDDFFALGGHSLLATQVVSRLRGTFGVDVPVRAFFEGATVAALAHQVERLRRSGAPVPPPLTQVERTGLLPLSFAQERLWFLDQLAPGNPAYNVPAPLRLTGTLNVPALREAFAELALRHESLRTVFPTVGGAPQQWVLPELPPSLPVVDLTPLPEPAREATALQLAAEEARRPFDLGHGPLTRCVLLRLSSKEHVLLLNVHHIVFDGWSIGILVRELATLYGAFLSGRPSPLMPLPVQYADFAAWQRHWLSSERLERQVLYWRERLLGAPPVLDLPLSRPRPPVRQFRGAYLPFGLPAERLSGLVRLQREGAATLFMVLATGFLALLSRLTGQEDLVVGSPVAGRNQLETEGLIGCFVNMLALRGDLSGAPSFQELLGRVRTAVLEAYEHQDLPFEKLVEELQTERSLSHSPVFQVVLVLQNAPAEVLDLPGLRLEPVAVPVDNTKFDLTLTLAQTAAGLSGSWEYDRDLFDATAVHRFQRHFGELLRAAVAEPARSLPELSCLSEAEHHQLLHEWNRAQESFAADVGLHELFSAVASQHPDAVAVTWEQENLSYGELDRRSGRLARRLRSLGVEPEVPVALCLERTPELVVAVLGVLKAGGAYVPIDPSYPEERQIWILEDSRARVVVTSRELSLQLPDSQARRLLMEEEDLASGEELMEAGTAGERLAYVIYTSGSTGRPKGVMVGHGNVVRLFTATQAWFKPGRTDVWTLFHSYAFDFSVWEIWGALLYGGRLVVVPYWTSRSPEAFHELLRQQGVTVLSQTPSAFDQLVRAGRDSKPAESLRLVVFGGEALDLSRLRPWWERHGEERPRLVNMYGITETTVHVTYRSVVQADLERPGSPIGSAIPDLELRVLDRWQQPVAMGVPGELCVGGAGLARGYLGRPELTAERFVPDPFGEQPGARLYRSGDLARYRTDGDLEHLGRIDHQVKIRGFRIELAEIEATLTTHPGVSEAVVVMRQRGEGERQLVAYVVPAREELTAAALRQFLRERQPEPMVPSAFVLLKRLPLTAHGKVDRRALPEPEAPGLDAGYTAPGTSLERELAEIWADVLQVKRVGAQDNFFDLGGDSIQSVRLVSRVNERLGGVLRVQDVFKHQTVAAMATSLAAGTEGRSHGQEHATGLAQIERLQRAALADEKQRSRLADGYEDFFPLSATEKGMIYYSLLLPDQPIYHDQYIYLVSIRDIDTFFHAFELLVGRHPVLRSTFHLDGFAEPMKVVHAQVPLRRDIEDLSDLDTDRQRKRIEQYRAEDLRNKLSFDGDLLWRLKLFRLTQELWCVALTAHHAILDGWSNVTLWTEMNDLCARPDLDAITALPPLASTYKDHVAIALGRERSAATEAFWRETLAGHERNRLPFQRSRTRTDAHGMDVRFARPQGDLLAELRARAAELHIPFKALCLAAHVHLLHATAGDADVVTGVVSHDRPGLPDGDRIIGCFLNSLPVRIRVRAGESGASLVRRVSDYLIACRAHEIPLVDIAGLVAAQGTGQNPIFDTLFNFLDFHLLAEVRDNVLFRPMATPGRRESLAVRGNEMTNTLLDLEVSATLGSLAAWIKYSPQHFEAPDIERALDLYLRILESLAREPAAPLGSQALLSAAEREQLVSIYNATEYPLSQRLLHSLFEEQAARQPERPAVVCGGSTLSYGQVEEQANRLARYLVASGVEVGENVGLIVERSPDLVVAMLAILKAGAAYVPMEPGYPAARKGYIVRQSQVRRLLADRIYELPEETQVEWLPLSAAELAGCSSSPLPARARPSDLAYTIYTSGSTGVPKGVMIEHGSAVNLIEWVNQQYEVGPGARVLMVSSVCFDLSVYDVFGALAAGAAVVVAKATEVQEPSALRHLVCEQGVTFWNSVPSTLGLLVQYLEELEPALRCESLEVIFLSGDWIPLALPERARRFFPRARPVSLGGATEAAVWSIFHPIEEIDPAWVSIPYGRPLANNTFYVLDSSLELVPSGVVGDLYIGGVGVARGYAGDPRKTAASFVPDPFARSAGARLYRAGDLGRMLGCGEIEFLGRSDFQVKVRGFRIELGEIESQLGRHPAIQEAVVTARTDRSGQKYLCAYLVSTEMPSPEELKAHLAQSLPEYMVPEVYVWLAELPLTGNGKVDRQRLPEPELANLAADRDYVAPSGEVESVLVTIWEEVLGVQGIGARHDYFALGGHSLSAVQVITRIRHHFGVELPLRSLFASPTIAGIAPMIAALRGESTALRSDGLAAAGSLGGLRPRPDQLPLSFAQQRIRFLQQLNPKSTAFNLPLVLRLLGRLDVPAFNAALSEICRRHETLRTTFPQSGDGPVQRIAPARPQPLPCVDLAGLPPERKEQESRLLVEEELARTFDLGRGPLLRTSLLRLAEDEHVGIFHLHHVVADGWSLGLLSEEAAELYTAFVQGLPSPLPELPVQYADYTLWQLERLSGEELERQLTYWRNRLGGNLPVLRLPSQRARPARPSYRGQMEFVHLSGDLSEAARKLARQEGVTIFVLLLAAFKALLRLYTGQEDIVVGTITANRSRIELEKLIGFFVNTLALRTDLSGDPTFRELIGRVGTVAFEAYEHQDVPFERLLETLELQRTGNAPVLPVKFQMQNFDGDARALPGLTLAPFESRLETSQSDLSLMIAGEDGEIRGTIVYSTDLFDPVTIQRFARHLEDLLDRFIAEPDRRLSSFSLLEEGEAEELIAAFNEI